MTLSEEKELEIIRQGLTYVKADVHSPEPHWDIKYPWIEDPSSLPNNRKVEATFLRTEKQLKKEPEWRPAGCIAQLAMRETVKLPMFAHLEEERRILEGDSYVDDIPTSHNDLGKLDKITRTVEEILKAGGFFLKPWVRSGQSGRREDALEHPASSNQVFILPSQRIEGDNKALGVGYQVKADKLHLMTSINFSKRRKKMRIGQNLLEEEVKGKTPNPLT